MGVRGPVPDADGEDAPQREHELREVFDALRYIVRTGAHWRFMPNDLPPWAAVYQQTQRWMAAGVFEAIVHDLRALLRGDGPRRRAVGGDLRQPHAAVARPRAGRGPATTGQSGRRARKVHMAVDTLGHLLALHVTPADEQDRAQVAELAAAGAGGDRRDGRAGVRRPGLHGRASPPTARRQGIELEVVKLPEAKRGFVLLPRRWVVERSFAWTARFRRLASDYERLAATLEGTALRRLRHRHAPALTGELERKFCLRRPARGLAQAAVGREGQPLGRRVLQAAPHAVGDIVRRFDVVALHVDDADGHVASARRSRAMISISANSRLAISRWISSTCKSRNAGNIGAYRRGPTARPL